MKECCYHDIIEAPSKPIAVDSYAYFHDNGVRLDLLGKVDTSKATSFRYAFNYCQELTEIPALDTSNCTDFNTMFCNCYALTKVPNLDTRKGTTFGNMFSNCYELEAFPPLDTSNGTEFGQMFGCCYKMTTAPVLDTSKGTGFVKMFNKCSALTTVPCLDIDKAFNYNSMFAGCTNLTNLTLYNVRMGIAISDGTSYGTLLTVESLVHTIQELCKVTTQKTLTMGSVNLAKIADLYCKVLDDTTEKIEMELCESTDEGAMTLAEYAALKKWKFV